MFASAESSRDTDTRGETEVENTCSSKGKKLKYTQTDRRRGLIEIGGEVKNEFRERAVPVCSEVGLGTKGIAVTEVRRKWFMVSEDGASQAFDLQAGWSWMPFGLGIHESSCHRINLRNRLPAFAVMRNLRNMVWESYIGHCPGRQSVVAAIHYVPHLGAASR
jgi:hypothetical protein